METTNYEQEAYVRIHQLENMNNVLLQPINDLYLMQNTDQLIKKCQIMEKEILSLRQ
jgi:hypothetical protein